MPKKDDRVIKQGVRFGRKVYLPGEEDELAELLTPEDAERLTTSGALEGSWTGKGKKAEPAKASAESSKK
jgi:hypothetical protein